MRTKALLALAALAIAIPASAQVYSANVVGYVNYTIQPGVFNMIANPLDAADNSIAALFPNASEGDTIFRWDTTANDLNYAATPFFVGGAWDQTFDLNPGEAIFYSSAASGPVTVTYVGEVIQGNFTNVIQPGVFNAIGSSAPLGGNMMNSIAGLTASEGDTIFLWDVTANDLNYATTPFYVGGAWDQTPDIAVGEGFFYSSAASGPVEWVRNFTVPQP